MSKSPTVRSPLSRVSVTRRYSPLWIEGLAYHEAGHVVMALALRVSIAGVEIAEECKEEGTNGRTEFADPKRMSMLHLALCLLASDLAERLAPNYDRLKTLKGFSSGRRNDKNEAFQALTPVYHFARLAESSARRMFREQTRPLLDLIMEQPANEETVHRVAEILIARKRMRGREIMRFRHQTYLPPGLFGE